MDSEHDNAVTAPAPAGSVVAGTTSRPPKWVVPVAIVLVLVLIAALIGAVWFGIKAVHGFSAERDRVNAVEAAKVVATDLTTFDTGTADADTKRLLATTTPEYAAALQGDANSVVSSMRTSQARSTGTVTEAGVLSFDPDTNTAQVLVSVRAQVANKSIPGGQARDYRMELTMVDQGGWLVDAVEFVA
jgi:Mce-associated membrane protein